MAEGAEVWTHQVLLALAAEMSRFEVATLWLQGVTVVATLGTIWVLFAQVRGLTAQLAAMREASAAEGALAVVQFLQGADIRASREVVRRTLSQKHHGEWDEAEKRHAAAVCANYDVAASLLRANIARLEFVVANWGPSIEHCHQVLSPYISHVRGQNGGSPDYWGNFEWLAVQVSKGRRGS